MQSFHFTWIILLLTTHLKFTSSTRKNSLRGTRWWTLADGYDEASYLETNQIPRRQSESLVMSPSMAHLTKKQRRLVEKNTGSLEAIVEGARQAIKECRYQFRSRPWNCPVQQSNVGGSIFGKILSLGCRETAFIYSITSAGVAHSMARTCSDGKVYTCSCDQYLEQPTDPDADWKWGGCSDNYKFGYKFSKRFTDSIEKGEDLRYMVNKQNNEAGRRHVVSGSKQECKCHGMSGSCQMKTCWMKLPTFREVGTLLKERFDGASKVYAGNDWGSSGNRMSSSSSGNNRPSRSSNDRISTNSINDMEFEESGNKAKRIHRNKYNFVTIESNHMAPTKKDMVYFEDSPDFCDSDTLAKYNFEGTSGRECNATSMLIDGCQLMCCGKGYRTETYTAKKRCHCTFEWCCEVHCEVCTEQRTRHICN
uniref:Protein Wnt n=1 Tax=Membranipora membranacea TaxID=95170 RepID=A0A1W6AZK7_MEMME|nr:wnt1 [Membranipora membranacea]